MAIDTSTHTTAVIAASGTTSGAVEIPEGRTLTAILTPGTLTGSTLTITASPTLGGTYYTRTDSGGNTLSIAMSTSKLIMLDPVADRTLGLRYIKLVSGSSEGAERTFTLFLSQL